MDFCARRLRVVRAFLLSGVALALTERMWDEAERFASYLELIGGNPEISMRGSSCLSVSCGKLERFLHESKNNAGFVWKED